MLTEPVARRYKNWLLPKCWLGHDTPAPEPKSNDTAKQPLVSAQHPRLPVVSGGITNVIFVQVFAAGMEYVNG